MIEYAVAGALGGLCKSLIEQKGKVALPSIETSKDEKGVVTKYVHLGFVVNIVLGAIAAYYLTVDPIGAFTSGVTAAFAIEKLAETTTKK